ncbi:hypothetical protein [Xenorhabdus cabanillasii]|uniref:Uncharacterized protein n=1 Tax=Xenorhabdus cabanillasii JM26 TaxID=1427517 RepID=W1JBU8_9GAMM|nr:hypothetical protein [Xenorhabdus cabanillasii]PHM76156.1 hypothetical protein Xcab_03361 [Xenorhabdus cabanillasii JM26]CDL87035.1 hypothetical protein XCR1_830010 [Xenorhabdus cabanillasii JM26]
MATETIDHSTLYRLVEVGAIRAAHVVGTPDGWAVMVNDRTSFSRPTQSASSVV